MYIRKGTDMKNEIGVRITYRKDTDLVARFKQAQEMELIPYGCAKLRLTELPFAERIVVTRHQEVANLCNDLKIKAILHAEPYQSDTVRIALENLAEFSGFLFCTGDQPFLKASSLEKLCASFLEVPNFIHRTKTPLSPY